MIDIDTLNIINKLLLDFQKNGIDYENNIGQGTKKVNSYSDILIDKIPELLYHFFDKKYYKIIGSVGVGRITSCPWIAIMHSEETQSPQQGVYLVFLFSKNLKHIYITFAQGVTNASKLDILSIKENLRSRIVHSENLWTSSDKMEICNEGYKQSVIFYSVWNCKDVNSSFELIQEYKNVYETYMKSKMRQCTSELSEFSISSIIKYIDETGLLYTPTIIKRFAFSLMSKHFLILSGLAGSGKTQLALAFASALIESDKQMCVIPVGADWTNRESLLGFPNALQESSYVKPECGALDLLIEANKEENANKPFFLVLDEMNMSYVERYFADFLSAMESHKPISLWNGNVYSDVPSKVALPDNLFIIGTINVDETTYMFSPKVLDRANVIEFKISEKEMSKFLSEMKDIDRDSINYKAACMGESFVVLSHNKQLANNENLIKDTLNSFFVNLKSVNAEFGYRSATEIYRFISQFEKNDDTADKLSITQILDCAIVQKLLPKLHGSRKKLEPVLQALWKECFGDDEKKETLSISREYVANAKFPLTADKIQRMYEAVYANGFTSFAEA